MNLRVEIDQEDKQILAMYANIREGLVYRTVEIEPGACYADEDEFGNLLGVEMLCPGEVKIYIPRVANHYPKDTSLEESLKTAFEKVAV